ncbi:MAG: transposase, partial [Planctomycetota bacterium]
MVTWVCLAMVRSHPILGVIALPLLSRLYVRRLDIDAPAARYSAGFRTKQELSLDLARQVI